MISAIAGKSVDCKTKEKPPTSKDSAMGENPLHAAHECELAMDISESPKKGM